MNSVNNICCCCLTFIYFIICRTLRCQCIVIVVAAAENITQINLPKCKSRRHYLLIGPQKHYFEALHFSNFDSLFNSVLRDQMREPSAKFLSIEELSKILPSNFMSTIIVKHYVSTMFHYFIILQKHFRSHLLCLSS